nr:MAG TPA: hypothetical protein [Caudoviricetes sp.]
MLFTSSLVMVSPFPLRFFLVGRFHCGPVVSRLRAGQMLYKIRRCGFYQNNLKFLLT